MTIVSIFLLWRAKWARIAERCFSVKNCSSIVFTTVKQCAFMLLICWEQVTCMSWTLSLVLRPLFCHSHNSSDRKWQKACQGLGTEHPCSIPLTVLLEYVWHHCLYTYILSHRCRNRGDLGIFMLTCPFISHCPRSPEKVVQLQYSG